MGWLGHFRGTWVVMVHDDLGDFVTSKSGISKISLEHNVFRSSVKLVSQ